MTFRLDWELNIKYWMSFKGRTKEQKRKKKKKRKESLTSTDGISIGGTWSDQVMTIWT